MEHLKQIRWLYAEKFLKDSSRSMIFQFARDKCATDLDQWTEFQQNQLSQSLSADLSENINILARKVAILLIRCRLQHILEQPWVKFPLNPILHYTVSSWIEKTITKTIRTRGNSYCFHIHIWSCDAFVNVSFLCVPVQEDTTQYIWKTGNLVLTTRLKT